MDDEAMADVGGESEAKRLSIQLRFRLKRDLGIDVSRIDGDAQMCAEGLHRLHKLMRQSAKHRDPWPTAPTPERLRQAAGVAPVEIEVAKDQPKAHIMRSQIEAMAGKLPIEHIAAALRLRRANELMHGGSRVVGYEERTGGGGYRPRDELTERQQAAGAFRAAMLLGWCDVQRAVIDNFVLEMPGAGSTRVLSPEEFGVAYGTQRNARLGRAECFGMIATTLSALHRRVMVWDRDQADVRRRSRRGAA